MPNEAADVIVVGAGNAAFCAALAAQEQGAKVLMLEAAPEDESGGNSRFTAGSIRVVYNGVDDIKTLVPDLTPAEIDTTDFGTYTADQFFDDMARVTQNRADPDLVELLVTQEFRLAELAAPEGRPFHSDLRPAGLQDRRQVQVLGRAHGRSRRRRARPRAAWRPRRRRSAASRSATPRAPSISSPTATASRACARATTARSAELRGKARSCSPAAASRPIRKWRTRYLGPGWDLAKVRGTRFNTGDGIRMALDIGASPAATGRAAMPCSGR